MFQDNKIDEIMNDINNNEVQREKYLKTKKKLSWLQY